MTKQLVAEGWLKGFPYVTARKAHHCNYWHGLSNGGRCKTIIQPGETYVAYEPNETAGGYGYDRFCLLHLKEE